QLSKMGIRTIVLYIVTTVIAVCIGLMVVNIVKPGFTISESTRTELVNSYGGDTAIVQEGAKQQRETGPLQALVDLVPENIIGASGKNANMLQVIFFAIFFGVCMILIPEKASAPVKKFFDSFNGVILKM